MICNCYIMHGNKSVCYGTKEMEECSCGGMKSKCNFYPEYRNAPMPDNEKITELISQIQYMGGLESRLAEHLISNGVKIPVLCKECKWYGVDSTKGGFCLLTASPSMWTDGITQLEPNDFCSRGERKRNGKE